MVFLVVVVVRCVGRGFASLVPYSSCPRPPSRLSLPVRVLDADEARACRVELEQQEAMVTMFYAKIGLVRTEGERTLNEDPCPAEEHSPLQNTSSTTKMKTTTTPTIKQNKPPTAPHVSPAGSSL